MTSNQLSPGMTISLNQKLYRVESTVKVSAPKGAPFIKAKLRDLNSNDLVEKSFKLNQPIKDVNLVEKRLEFLYPENEGYLFLDIVSLDQILIPNHIIEDKVNYLKEGVEVKGSLYGDIVFSVELPLFLELMVVKNLSEEDLETGTPSKIVILETGATVEVPRYIEIGDIIKVDTKTKEYIQRV